MVPCTAKQAKYFSLLNDLFEYIHINNLYMDQQTTNSILGTEQHPAYTPTSDERTMALLSHILTIVCVIYRSADHLPGKKR